MAEIKCQLLDLLIVQSLFKKSYFVLLTGFIGANEMFYSVRNDIWQLVLQMIFFAQKKY